MWGHPTWSQRLSFPLLPGTRAESVPRRLPVSPCRLHRLSVRRLRLCLEQQPPSIMPSSSSSSSLTATPPLRSPPRPPRAVAAANSSRLLLLLPGLQQIGRAAASSVRIKMAQHRDQKGGCILGVLPFLAAVKSTIHMSVEDEKKKT